MSVCACLLTFVCPHNHSHFRGVASFMEVKALYSRTEEEGTQLRAVMESQMHPDLITEIK